MSKFLKIILAIALAIALVHPVLAEDGKDEQVVVVEPQVQTEEKYAVKKGDTLGKIYQQNYSDSASPKRIRALAGWKSQVTHPKLWVFTGQQLELPRPLVLTQTVAGENPTTLSRSEAVKAALEQLPKSLQEARLPVNLSNATVERMVNALESSTQTVEIDGQIYAVVTYGKSAQGWTKTRLEKGSKGPKAVVPLNEDYSLRVIEGKSCNNIYLQLLKIIPPPPPLPPPPPPSAPEEIVKQYSEVIRKPQVDVVGGADRTWYSDGANDTSFWTYGAVRWEVGTDRWGNKYSAGPYTRLSGYTGQWNDPKGVVKSPVNFHGGEFTLGAEARMMTPSGREPFTRLGYLWGWDKMSMSDSAGESKSSFNRDSLVGEVGLADYSRKDEKYLSEYKVTLGYEHVLNSRGKSTFTDKTGRVTRLAAEQASYEGPFVAAEADLVSFGDKKQITLTADVYGKFGPERKVGIGKLYVNFFDKAFGIGVKGSAASYKKGGEVSNATGIGLTAQVNPVKIYRLIKGEGKSDEDIPQGLITTFPVAGKAAKTLPLSAAPACDDGQCQLKTQAQQDALAEVASQGGGISPINPEGVDSFSYPIGDK